MFLASYFVPSELLCSSRVTLFLATYNSIQSNAVQYNAVHGGGNDGGGGGAAAADDGGGVGVDMMMLTINPTITTMSPPPSSPCTVLYCIVLN